MMRNSVLDLGRVKSQKICRHPGRDVSRGQTSAEIKSGVAWRKYSMVARARWTGAVAQALVCESALITMATVAAGTKLSE